MSSLLYDVPIHLDFEFYCLLTRNFIYVTHVIDDTVTLDIGVVYFIEASERGFAGSASCLRHSVEDLNEGVIWNEESFRFDSIICSSMFPIESLSINEYNVYYKLFERLSILDGSSCRAVIESIQQ